MSTISDKFKYKKAQKLEQQGNIQEAIDIYKKLANAGYPEAQYKYGTLYEEGKYLPKSEAEAVRWYAKSATGDCADGYNELGRCYYYGTGMKAIDYKKAFECFKYAAYKDHPKAQFNLAVCFENGRGTTHSKKFPVEAFSWYKKAALQNYTESQYRLGLCYELGIGTDINLNEAFGWYEKAALQGNDKAQCNLGICYEFGYGTKVNIEKAFEWYEKAALQGYARAQCNLANCYYKGDGTLTDYSKAVEFYEKAALQGYERAQFNLAVCFEFAEGTEKNIDKAIEWYEKAASQGHKRAYYRLANIYYNGSDNVEKDLQKALNLCSKSDLTQSRIKALYEKIQKEILEEKELQKNKRLVRLEQILAYRFDKGEPIFSLPTELENNTVFNHMESGEIYHLAVKKEQEGKTDHAIFLYGVAASKGNRKALYTLSNMSQHDTEYFMIIEDHSNKEG